MAEGAAPSWTNRFKTNGSTNLVPDVINSGQHDRVPNVVTNWQDRCDNWRDQWQNKWSDKWSNTWTDRCRNWSRREEPPCPAPPRQPDCPPPRPGCDTGYTTGYEQGLIPFQDRAYNNSQGQTWNTSNGYGGQVTQRRFGNGMGTTGSQYYSANTFPGVQNQSQNGFGSFNNSGSVGNYFGAQQPNFGYGGYPNPGRETSYNYNVSTPMGEQSQWSSSFTDGVQSVSQWASNGFQQVMNGWSNNPVVGGLGSMLNGNGWNGGISGGSFGGVSNLSAMPYGGNSLGFSGSSQMGGGGFSFF